MILATVGTQLPFPRLIRALDDLAPELDCPLVAQTGLYTEKLRHIEHHVSMDPREFDVLFRQARVVVAHAGIGTVLAAKKHCKPLIVFPRRAALGEHRNDHQVATAKQLSSHQGIYVAWDEVELRDLLMQPSLDAPTSEVSPSLRQIRSSLRAFVAEAFA